MRFIGGEMRFLTVYRMSWSGGGGGGGGGTVDATARSDLLALKARLDKVNPQPATTVGPNSTNVLINTTDQGVQPFSNPSTTFPVTLPANPTVANLLAAGLTQGTTSSGATDTKAIANLSADTWTAIPSSTIVPSPKTINVIDGAGNDITDTVNIRKNGANWEIISSIAMSNLSVVLEA